MHGAAGLQRREFELPGTRRTSWYFTLPDPPHAPTPLPPPLQFGLRLLPENPLEPITKVELIQIYPAAKLPRTLNSRDTVHDLLGVINSTTSPLSSEQDKMRAQQARSLLARHRQGLALTEGIDCGDTTGMMERQLVARLMKAMKQLHVS